MPVRGYPKTRFEYEDNTRVLSVAQAVTDGVPPTLMLSYTSDKGTEEWEYITGLSAFSRDHGGISFAKHGQAQITVAEFLRAGGYVWGKRMVSDDATLANTTIKARVVESNGVNYVYFHATSVTNTIDINTAASLAYGDFDPEAEDNEDFPLFTITPVGRGASNITFRIDPVYARGRASTQISRYDLEIYDDGDLVGSILFCLNPDAVLDQTSQNLNAKVLRSEIVSKQIKAKIFEDGIFAFFAKLIGNTTLNGEVLSGVDLINHDCLFGKSKNGVALGGLVCAPESSDTTDDEWTANIPSDIADNIVTLNSTVGISLPSGSYGTLGRVPMENMEEYNNLLLDTWGKSHGMNYDPIIYDLDANKPAIVADCAYPFNVKEAIADVCDFRGDGVFLADLGTQYDNLDSIVEAAENITRSRFVAIYHNYFNITDPYSRKEITVTMPLLLAKRFPNHMVNGVGRAFMGISNGFQFSEIIPGTVNFCPAITPEIDQKQIFADNCINYLNYYDGLPVMETDYSSYSEYTQMSYIHNIMAIQEVVRAIRQNCPKSRYTFLDGDDLDEYIRDANRVISKYKTNFKSIYMQYMADERYESQNIFYAVITVVFHQFIQEEYFRVIAIS